MNRGDEDGQSIKPFAHVRIVAMKRTPLWWMDRNKRAKQSAPTQCHATPARFHAYEIIPICKSVDALTGRLYPLMGDLCFPTDNGRLWSGGKSG